MTEIGEVEKRTLRYRQTGVAHEEARKDVIESVLRALRAGDPPTAVAAASPFSEVYVRKLARENGIPDYVLQRFPKARGELERLLPTWRDAARTIGELGAGLDDAEYVGGVLWTGLTHKGAEGNPEEQKRVIVDRLARWATRDGGSATEVAAAVRSVMDEYVPG